MYWYELFEDCSGQSSGFKLTNPKHKFLEKYKNMCLENHMLNTRNGMVIQQMHACCGVVLLHGSSSKLGWGCTLAKLMGYSQANYIVVVGCTVQDEDEDSVDFAQTDHIKELTKLGFKRLAGSEIVNSRTDNILVTYTLDLSTFKYTGEL